MDRIILAFTLLFSIVSANCLHGTSFWPRVVKRDGTVQVSSFGYTGTKGPLRWHQLAANNSACRTGKNQSPINIDASISNATEPPKIDFPNVETAEFENLGSTVEVVMGNGTTTLAGKSYTLDQFHFHTPSEHRINEEYFPIEMHMVHTADDSSVLVLGVVFDVSPSYGSPLMNKLAKALPAISKPGSVTEIEGLDFAPLVSHLTQTPLRQYSGSLTTPPCRESVTFLVSDRPMPVTVQSFNAFKKVIKFNSRYTQNTLGAGNLLENL